MFCFYPLSNFIPCFSPIYFTPGFFTLPWWLEFDISLLLACFLACFLHSSYLIRYSCSNQVLVFSPILKVSSHCQVSQFTGTAYTGNRWCVQQPQNSLCWCQLAQMGKTSRSLNLHFTWLSLSWTLKSEYLLFWKLGLCLGKLRLLLQSTVYF